MAFHTDAILSTDIDNAHKWAAAYKKWPVTEGRVTTTYASDSDPEVGFTYPEGWKSDSIRLLQVGGKRFTKLNFFDYQAFREDNSSDEEKIFSDFGRQYYINPQSDASGTTTLWGQFTPAEIDNTDPDATTVFSDADEEGNEAILNEVLSYAKMREKKFQEAEAHHQKAIALLERMWERIAVEQHAYQTKNRGIWERINVLEGGVEDELLRRDQWY